MRSPAIPSISSRSRRRISPKPQPDHFDATIVDTSVSLVAVGSVPITRTAPRGLDAWQLTTCSKRGNGSAKPWQYGGPRGPPLSREGVAELVALRPAADIAAKLDLLYCLHRAVRENQLRGAPGEWPEQLVHGAIWERRHALEQLIQVDVAGWDDVDLST
jgi:hypothetical protein